MPGRAVYLVRYGRWMLLLHQSTRQVHPTRSYLASLCRVSFLLQLTVWHEMAAASMVQGSLELLERLVRSNDRVAQSFSEAIVKVTAPVPGRNIPENLTDLPELNYGYAGSCIDPSGSGELIEVTYISVPCLLAERFVHSPSLWSHDGHDLDIDLSARAMPVLESYFRASKAVCSLSIQHILAPPPPPFDPDESFEMALPHD